LEPFVNRHAVGANEPIHSIPYSVAHALGEGH